MGAARGDDAGPAAGPGGDAGQGRAYRHEPIKDTGLRRTYPNWVARGLAFTRMLSGPFDFTPGVVSLTGKDNSRIPSILAKQLAL
ncbi:hypothetical protein FBZ89_10166 [Nitrospirillum amazonense]|uniref:Uncharacterized protein n=1 Tax=Nitrospirillum amazonense TaxID=28077 RepID=A0A560FS80_9PROT|nr:hypothetical protein [Nitrospirillum amazonense]TWB24441.1 hypothetical protein FBZ89_10166 [Nitrospirillum amazonense]